jgi:signal transduction histidine kinase
VNRDAEAERATAAGARRALAAVGHELASPLTALYTYLKLAPGDHVGSMRRCADRIQVIAELVRELAALDDPPVPGATDLAIAIESGASRLGLDVELERSGEVLATIAPDRASTIATALLRAVVSSAPDSPLRARVFGRGQRAMVRLGPGIEPTTWQVVEPWRSSTRHKLELWAAAVAAGAEGSVRVGEVDGQIAVELELPAAGSR